MIRKLLKDSSILFFSLIRTYEIHGNMFFLVSPIDCNNFQHLHRVFTLISNHIRLTTHPSCLFAIIDFFILYIFRHCAVFYMSNEIKLSILILSCYPGCFCNKHENRRCERVEIFKFQFLEKDFWAVVFRKRSGS